MSHDNVLTDEYVAGLLVKDAKESSIKYSAMGLEGFESSKPPPNKLKPNTRFLRSIIQETDNHNAALLAKEAAESRARLASLPRQSSSSSRPPKVTDSDIRRRQMGDITAILAGGAGKRRKIETTKSENTNSRRANTSSEDERPTKKEDKEMTANVCKDEDKYNKSRHRRSGRHHRSDTNDRRRYDDSRERPSRSRSPREHRKKESRHRHRSPRRRRSRSRERQYSELPSQDYKSSRRQRSISQGRSSSREKSSRSHRRRRSPDDRRTSRKETSKATANEPSKLDEDSDPLDDIIGPKPPTFQKVHRKGRGITSLESGIDARFSSNYDPTVDVQLDHDEEEDWDQALEALRDRQKWKQQGAERLRSAGFTEDEIRKWEKGGEKNEEDVRWTKRGEAREWDRGKVFNDEGQVVLEADFGRLKGT